MFNPNTKDMREQTNAETFIGPSVKLEGNFTGDGDVVIEGMLIGNLTTKGDVRVGANAMIEAEVRAKNATIAGKLKGNLTVSNNLKLTGTSNISGDIKAMTLAIDEGAVINGKILMSRDRSAKDSLEAPAAEKSKT